MPLGLSNGFIKNEQITATSQYEPNYYGYTARLKLFGIRWCGALTDAGAFDLANHIQVDFKSVVTLTGVATQGDDSHSPNFVTMYYLEVSMDGDQYSEVVGGRGTRQVCVFRRK